MAPSRASRSTLGLFQNERSVPVSFSLPIVCSAPLSEKKLVSPEKNAPFKGNGSSVAAGSVVDWNEAGAVLAGCGSHVEGAVTGALHQASLVAPAADAISAVSAGAAEASSLASGQVGALVSAGGAVSSCGQTGAAHAGSSTGACCSGSTVSF